MAIDKYDAIWQGVCDQIKNYENIDLKQVEAFFPRLHPQAYADGYMMLTAENAFIKDWVETRYLGIISQALEDIYGMPFDVAIEVDTSNTGSDQGESAPISSDGEVPAPAPAAPAATPVATPTVSAAGKSAPVSEYTFDNYVVGGSNRLAYSMALAVAETPGAEQFNPLFIYGKSGIGKTHLLRAIQDYINVNYPQMKTVYVDAMTLVNDYTDAAIRGGNEGFKEFKNHYSTADVLLIDDVQELQGRTETLNIVFQIFNDMIDSGKQVVLSADRAPKSIDIDERYRSRFNSGGTCDILPPEIETKLGIIRNYVDECQKKDNSTLELDEDVENYIAYNSGSNIRELKSAIVRLMMEAKVTDKNSFTVDEVSHILEDHFSGGSMKRLTIPEIQRAVENYYGISHADLVGKSRKGPIIYSRQVAMYLCRNMIDVSFSAIGEAFDKDHATVMHSVNVITAKLKENRELNEEIEIIRKMILE